MKFEQIIQNIKAGQFAPVYFLMGEEAYFIDEVMNLIEEKGLPEDQKSFNQTILYADKQLKIGNVIAEAKRYPMMADRVVVLVKEAQHISKWDGLEEYLKNPTPSMVLAFAYKYKKLDKRKSLYKKLDNVGIVMESKKLYDNQLPKWIASYGEQKQISFTPGASLLMAESLGSDLSRVANEIDKLCILVKPDSTVDEQAIEDNIGISKDYNNFELTKTLGKKDLAKAITIQKYFSANPKDHPLVLVLGVLYSYFSKLMMVNHSKNFNNSAIASLIGVNPFFADEYAQAARQYDLKKLARIIGYLRECDRKSKGIGNARTSDSELLKELIFKIIYV